MAGLSLAVAALLSILVGLWQLTSASDGLRISRVQAAGVPITLYRPATDEPAPTVVIAHGFAGSQHMMRTYAVTLARNGYSVATFDFPGHGRNAAPFVANLLDQDKRLGILLGALESAVDVAMSQANGDGRLALLGHSMAGDVLARYAVDHPGRVTAVVLLSPYISEGTATDRLPNLLQIYGEWEPEMLHQQGLKILARGGSESVAPGVTYGLFADRTGRRLDIADGVEHIGVLYGMDGLSSALEWLDRSFGRSGSGFLYRSGPWLGLLYLGLLLLVWPLSGWLPRPAERPLGAGLTWRRLLPVAVAPALLTPLLLWKLPSDFLPILLGDYLALHFAIYGMLTLLALWLSRRRDGGSAFVAPAVKTRSRALLIAMTASTLYATLAFAVPTDRFVTVLLPGAERLPQVLAILVGTLTYFMADEWATRGERAARGGYAFTKLLFLLSLMFAVALNLQELFFLVIIVPAMLILFLVYGLMSAWLYRRTNHPLVAAVANAAIFAIAVAVTFPVVGA